MGEVDDVAEIEDQREPERHQHVERADDQAVGDVEQKELGHGISSLELRSCGHRYPPVKMAPARSCCACPGRLAWSLVARQAGHCRVQPVSDTGGEVLSPATMESTRNRSSRIGGPLGLGLADEGRRHQLVVALAVVDLVGLQLDVGRQLEIAERLGELERSRASSRGWRRARRCRPTCSRTRCARSAPCRWCACGSRRRTRRGAACSACFQYHSNIQMPMRASGGSASSDSSSCWVPATWICWLMPNCTICLRQLTMSEPCGSSNRTSGLAARALIR